MEAHIAEAAAYAQALGLEVQHVLLGSVGAPEFRVRAYGEIGWRNVAWFHTRSWPGVKRQLELYAEKGAAERRADGQAFAAAIMEVQGG